MSTITAAEKQLSPGDTLPWRFVVKVSRDRESPELTRVEVNDSDLSDAIGELWRDGYLRRGQPQTRLEDVRFELQPRFAKAEKTRCKGFRLRAVDSNGDLLKSPFERKFSVESFSHVAANAAQELIQQGVLESAVYVFDVEAHQRPPTTDPTADILKTTLTTSPIRFLTQPLEPLRRQAKFVGEPLDGAFPVLYTAEAFKKVEHFARKGADSQPARETGAVLVGPLCSCPESGEFYAVVCDALEAQEADESEFSISYTGKTWMRIQTVMRARQAQEAMRAHRILGQAHGHNFLPLGGAPPCELCSKIKTCTRTSVFVSADDRTWSRAVFAHQPWQLCHIFGLNARQEKVHNLFTLKNNCLSERGFYIIDNFYSTG